MDSLPMSRSPSNLKTNHHLLGEILKARIKTGMDQSLFFSGKDYYPLNHAAVVCLNDMGERVIEPMQFGLVPYWLKKEDKYKTYVRKYSTFNDRSETAHEKPSFKAAFKSRRCLIPGVSNNG